MTKGKSTTKENTHQANAFTEEERAAMKARAKELKAEARAEKSKAAGEEAVLAAIAEMPEGDRVLAERLHAIVQANAPELAPKTWYGMPAYAQGEGKVVCFFQGAHKFGTRYATFGFNDTAALDEGALWPVAFAVKELTEEAEERVGELVRRAVGR